jgi:hypothetical protein
MPRATIAAVEHGPQHLFSSEFSGFADKFAKIRDHFGATGFRDYEITHGTVPAYRHLRGLLKPVQV